MRDKRPRRYHVVERTAADWTRGEVRGSTCSRVAARRLIVALRNSVPHDSIVMILDDAQLARAQREGFATYA